jgi:hypothetical protein
MELEELFEGIKKKFESKEILIQQVNNDNLSLKKELSDMKREFSEVNIKLNILQTKFDSLSKLFNNK